MPSSENVEYYYPPWSPTSPEIQAYEKQEWQNSPRDHRGKLMLRDNPCLINYREIMGYRATPSKHGNYTIHPSLSDPLRGPDGVPFSWTNASNIAYANFMKQAKAGNASLGVTGASFRQSLNMITKRLGTASAVLKAAGALSSNQLKSRKKRIRKEREPLANTVLEVNFGWTPTVGDIHESFATLARPFPNSRITGHGKSRIAVEVLARQSNFGRRGYMKTVDSTELRTTYSADVKIVNYNTWLLEGLGLINPGTVIWDLIPWSFVVNMFFNVNQLLGAMTDEVGLEVQNRHVTWTSKATRSHSGVWFDDVDSAGFGGSLSRGFYKERRRLTTFPVAAQARIPSFKSLGFALTASALLLQRAERLNKKLAIPLTWDPELVRGANTHVSFART